MRPNLFKFATRELSQDAVLCWLLSWAEASHMEDHPHLHMAGKALLTLIYQRANVQMPVDFVKVDVHRQRYRIDVLCIINGETAILIEDKVGTKEHSEQLERYKNIIHDKCQINKDKIIPVYIQTGDQSDYKEVVNKGYFVLGRKDLLEILEDENCDIARHESDILSDFVTHLRGIEDEVLSYKTLPPSEWGDNARKGFLMNLQDSLGNGDWSYVPNPSGGFIGYYWKHREINGYKVYLQLEGDKFCYKIEKLDKPLVYELRDYWCKEVIARCHNYGIQAKRPERFGRINSRWLTIAVLDQEFPAVNDNGLLDMSETLKLINLAETALDDCNPFAL